MAPYNRSNGEERNSYDAGDQPRLPRISTRHLPVLISGLIIATLFVAVEACSHKSGNSNAKASIQPPVSAPAPAAVASAPVAPPISKSTKRIRRHRPPVVTYASKDYGVSVRYPRKYDLRLGDEAQLTWPGLGPVQTSFLKPGGVTVAAIEMPDNSFPGTDFASGFLSLSVNSGLTNEECMQFAAGDKDAEINDPASIEIGKIEFREVEKIIGQNQKQADAKYFHAFQNNACYEIALGLGTVGDEAQAGITQVDRSQVFGRLEKILSSIQFKAVEVPITAPATDSASTPPVTIPQAAVPPSPQPVTSGRI